MPALGVRMRQPAQEGGQLPVRFGPEDEMPVIGHEAVGEDSGRVLLESLGEHALEGLVIAGLLEERQARDGTIEGVIDKASRSGAPVAWHAKEPTTVRSRVQAPN